MNLQDLENLLEKAQNEEKIKAYAINGMRIEINTGVSSVNLSAAGALDYLKEIGVTLEPSKKKTKKGKEEQPEEPSAEQPADTK